MGAVLRLDRSPGKITVREGEYMLKHKGIYYCNTAMRFFVVLLLVMSGCASMPITPIEDRSIQKVHDIDLTKNEIYDISLEWMAQNFSDSRSVIELKDKDNGKIIGKGITSFRGKIGIGSANVLCRFTLTVEAKDNKYRTTYNNFVGLWGESYNRPEPVEQKKYVDDVKAKLILLDDSLYSYLKKYKSNTNW